MVDEKETGIRHVARVYAVGCGVEVARRWLDSAGGERGLSFDARPSRVGEELSRGNPPWPWLFMFHTKE